MQEPNENIKVVDRRETPKRLRSMTTLMLVFAILNTVELFTIFIHPILFYVLTVATLVLPIILLAMAPRGNKVGIASWLGIAAFIVLVLAFILTAVMVLNLGVDIDQLVSMMESTSESLQSRAVGYIMQAALPVLVGFFISWILRIVSVVFGYISYVSLKNSRDLAESADKQM